MKRATTTNMQTIGQIEGQMTLDREVKAESITIATSVDSLHIRLESSTKTELRSDEEVTTTTREYDTDKPVDPVTGTPPLKRETTETRRKTDLGQQEQTALQTADRQSEYAGRISGQQSDSMAIRGNSRGQVNTAAKIETAEKRGLNTTQRVLCSIGALAVLAGLVWLGRKLLKRYL